MGAGFAAVAILVALGAVWYRNTGSGARQALADAYEDVHPQRFGHVIVDEKSGSGRPLEAAPSQTVAVAISPADESTTRSAIEATLTRQGFEHETVRGLTGIGVGTGRWTRHQDGHRPNVSVEFVVAGKPSLPRRAAQVPPGSIGVFFAFIGHGS